MSEAPLLHLRSADPRLAGLIDRIGPCRMKLHPPEFCTLARAIVSQQLSSKAAATICGRLEQRLAPAGVEADAILRLAPEELRALGLSTGKTKYLRSLAERTLDGTINFTNLGSLPDEDVIHHLTSAQGVGVWTAQMFLIFALQREDVLPTDDLGIRNAMQRLYRLRKAPDAARMQKIAKPWRPYCSVACWYLWRSLENAAAL